MAEESSLGIQATKGKEMVGAEQNLPDSVYRGSIRGTILFPQMFFAQTALAGFEAMTLIRRGDYAWKQLGASRFSKNQLDKTRERLVKVYNAYGMSELSRVFADRDKAEHLDSELQTFWVRVKNRIFFTASDFADWATEDKPYRYKPPIQLDTPINLTETAEHLAMFFTKVENTKEIEALISLWGTVVKSVQSAEAQKIGRSIRESFKGLYGNGKAVTSDRTIKVRSQWEQMGQELKTITYAKVNQELSNIEGKLGRKIPNEVIRRFLEEGFSTEIAQQRSEQYNYD